LGNPKFGRGKEPKRDREEENCQRGGDAKIVWGTLLGKNGRNRGFKVELGGNCRRNERGVGWILAGGHKDLWAKRRIAKAWRRASETV